MNKKILRRSLALLLLALAAGAGAQIYRWVDERGITHLSNRPPTGMAVEVDEETRNPPPSVGREPAEPPPGTAVEVDEETALREVEAAFDARDYAKARAILTPLAERGNPRAQNGLGILYGRGLGVPQDLDRAFKLHQQAARQGYGLAQYYLGLLYADGQGVPEDPVEGAKWLRAAAEQGVSNAQFTLGVMYEKGEGVERDSRQAAAWYRRAAEQGHASAQYNLALLYARGEGVPRNPAAALRWEQKAAEHGDARAQYRLGLRYAEGSAGVPRDPRAAFQWIRQALARGYPLRLELEPGWTVGHYDERPGQAAILEFVRAGDTIERWRELLTLQQFPPQGDGSSVREVFQRLQALRETACPGATVWKVIHQDATTLLYEWQAKPCRGWPHQHEIAKIIHGPSHTSVLRYTVKTYRMRDEQRAEWIARFAEAR